VLNTWLLWSPLQHLNARNPRSFFPVTGKIYIYRPFKYPSNIHVCTDAQHQYSEGAQVTHLAAGYIPEDLYSNVSAIVLFGDPDNGDAFPGSLNDNVKAFCNDGDLICHGLPIVLEAHLHYDHDVGKAAAFIAARV
jgi:hypothetical protein